MNVDLPGSIVPFSEVRAGSLFGHMAGGEFEIGMRIDVPGLAGSEVLSFRKDAAPFLQILKKEKFENRDVLVFEGPTLRLLGQLHELRDSALNKPGVGSVILAEQGRYFRTSTAAAPTQVDINAETGAGSPAKQHPGSMIANRWEIIVPGRPDDFVIFRHDQHAGAK